MTLSIAVYGKNKYFSHKTFWEKLFSLHLILLLVVEVRLFQLLGDIEQQSTPDKKNEIFLIGTLHPRTEARGFVCLKFDKPYL